MFADSKRVQTWTRQFVCSPKSDQIKPPKLWDSLLQAATADRKTSLEIWGQQPSKWIWSWRKLIQVGKRKVYSRVLVRTARQGYRCLIVIIGPNTTETVKDFRGQEKIFVRSLQQDLSMDEVVNSQLVRHVLSLFVHVPNTIPKHCHLITWVTYMLMKHDAFFPGRRSTGNVL